MKKLILALGLFVTGLAFGAAGDAIYRVRELKSITGAEALCYANCARTQDAWSGTAADMRSLCVSRTLSGSGFEIAVTGVKRAPLSSIVTSEGVTVEGVEAE